MYATRCVNKVRYRLCSLSVLYVLRVTCTGETDCTTATATAIPSVFYPFLYTVLSILSLTYSVV